VLEKMAAGKLTGAGEHDTGGRERRTLASVEGRWPTTRVRMTARQDGGGARRGQGQGLDALPPSRGLTKPFLSLISLILGIT